MPLTKQKITIDLKAGIDQKTDPKGRLPVTFETLENGVFNKDGRIDKRTGNTALTSNIQGGGSLSSPNAIAGLGSQLLCQDNSKLYSYSDAATKWVEKGDIPSAVVTTSQIYAGTESATFASSAKLGDYTAFAFLVGDTDDGSNPVDIVAIVYDDDKKLVVHQETISTDAMIGVKVLADSSNIYFVYAEDSASTLYGRILTPGTDPTSIGSAVTLSSEWSNAPSLFDARVYDDGTYERVILAYVDVNNVTGFPDLVVEMFNSSLSSLSSDTLVSTTSTDVLDDYPINILFDPDDYIVVTYGAASGPDDAMKFRVYTITTSGTVVNRVSANGTLDDSTNYFDDFFRPNMVVAKAQSGGTGLDIYYDNGGVVADIAVNGLTQSYARIRKITLEITGGGGGATIGTPSEFKYNLDLVSQPFQYGSDWFMICVAYIATDSDGGVAGTYFVVRDDGEIVAKHHQNLAGTLSFYRTPVDVSTISSGVYQYAIHKKARFTSTEGDFQYTDSIEAVRLDFTENLLAGAEEIGNTLIIPGGIVRMYDGLNVTELNFLKYPTFDVLTDSASGGSMSNGTYSYKAVYEWYDANGVRHQSQSSPAYSQVVNGGGSSQSVAVDVNTIDVTTKDGTNRTKIKIAIYRTVNAGTIYYRVGTVDNDTTTTIVTYTDQTSDSALVGNEPLYTTGGTLENDCPPACKEVTIYNNRAFLTGLENENEAWFSNEVLPGYAAEFNAALVVNVEGGRSGIQGAGVIDDKLCFFKPDSIFIIYGRGPSRTGQDFFAEPQKITSDVGCSQRRSIVLGPKGLMFMSEKGIYLLDGSLTPTYIGAAVEDLNSSAVTSAELFNDLNQIRFTALTDVSRIYDYYFNRWVTHTGPIARHARVVDGVYYVANTAGAIWKDDQTVYTDGGFSYGMTLETNWLNLAGVGGFQRVYKIVVVGERLSDHDLTISVGYDYNDTYADTATFDTSANVDDDDRQIFEIRPSRQKCEALRLKIASTNHGGDESAFNISGIAVVVGIKQGTARLKSGLTIGVT